MGTTRNFNLQTLGPGQSISDNGYKFSLRDREVIDALLRAALSHRHTGDPLAEDVVAPAAPTVAVAVGESGTLQSDFSYHYRVSLVDEYGRESEASEATSFVTDADITAPVAPSLAASVTGGTLGPGTYLYAISLYQGDIYSETLTGPASQVSVANGGEGLVTLTLPDPGDADGFNVYRLLPSGLGFFYIGSIEGSGTFVDDGLVEDCNRLVPYESTLENDIALKITFPDSPVPEGYTWKIYRTEMLGLWENTLIQHVTESSGGYTVGEFVDLGYPKMIGSPDSSSVEIINPEQVDLTAEVSGILPVENGGTGTIAKFADEVRTSDDSLLPDDTLVMDLSEDVAYAFEYRLMYMSPTAADLSLQISGPLDSPINAVCSALPTSATSATGNIEFQDMSGITVGNEVTVGGAGDSVLMLAVITGTVTASLDGQLVLSWSQGVSDVSDTTMLQGSSLKLNII